MLENFNKVLYSQHKDRVKKSEQFVYWIKSYARLKFRKNAVFVSKWVTIISRPDPLSIEDTILLKVTHV